MHHRPMASHLRALEAHRGPELPVLPLESCAHALGLDGLGLLLAPEDPPPELLQSFGERTGPLEDLQLTQGQGPTLDATRKAALVLAPDMSSLTLARWPGLSLDVLELGVHAVFAFPLRYGVIALGSLTGHRTTPGAMSPDELTDALALAGTLSSLLIGIAARPAHPSVPLIGEDGLHFAEVHQATGMLSAQLGISPVHALVKLRAHAFLHERPLLHVARALLARELQLHADGQDDAQGQE